MDQRQPYPPLQPRRTPPIARRLFAPIEEVARQLEGIFVVNGSLENAGAAVEEARKRRAGFEALSNPEETAVVAAAVAPPGLADNA